MISAGGFFKSGSTVALDRHMGDGISRELIA
jgi:hypothetical protein